MTKKPKPPSRANKHVAFAPDYGYFIQIPNGKPRVGWFFNSKYEALDAYQKTKPTEPTRPGY